MPRVETVLPQELQFDFAVSVLRDEIDDVLIGNIEKNDDILGHDLEFDRDVSNLWNLSGCLARLLKAEDELLDEVHTSIYRAITFALDVIDGIEQKDDPCKISLKWVAQIDDDIAKAIRRSVKEYISANPNICSLIEFYSSEIESEDVIGCQEHVVTAAGLIFMLREREVAERYLASQVDSLNPDSLPQ